MDDVAENAQACMCYMLEDHPDASPLKDWSITSQIQPKHRELT